MSELSPADRTRQSYGRRIAALEDMSERLCSECSKALKRSDVVDSVTFRAKKTDSFVVKSQATAINGLPKYSNPLTQIEDQVAGRVIVKFVSSLIPVTQALMEWFGSAVETTRKRPETSSFGYESDHFIISIPADLKTGEWASLAEMPTVFEVQVRTIFMHAYAQPEHLLRYKGGLRDNDSSRMLAWIAASAWGADQAFDGLYKSLGQE